MIYRKYHNTKVFVNGIKFDSKLEAGRYRELLLLEQAGQIRNLRRQVEFELQPSFKKNGKTIRKISYFADFVYMENGFTIVEDTKGYRGGGAYSVFSIKKKIFEYKFPELTIKEVTR